MALAKGVAGPGWKAATINAARWPFLALLPTAPLGILLMRIPALYASLWPVGQRASVTWIDNQYAVVTPQGKVGFGLVNLPHTQSLLIEAVKIVSLI
jgi:hypothetical protein